MPSLSHAGPPGKSLSTSGCVISWVSVYTPGCGFGIGAERVLLLLEGQATTADDAPDAYFVHVGERATRLALEVAENLRDAGLSITVNAGGGNFGAQMKRADASGARFALIVGENEADARVVAVKPLRIAGEQVSVDPRDLPARLASR